MLAFGLKREVFTKVSYDMFLRHDVHPRWLCERHDRGNRGASPRTGAGIFSHATVHVAKADADHWLDPQRSAAGTSIQGLVHDAVLRALAPYSRHRSIRNIPSRR
jgi:hypothetical protein